MDNGDKTEQEGRDQGCVTIGTKAWAQQYDNAEARRSNCDATRANRAENQPNPGKGWLGLFTQEAEGPQVEIMRQQKTER